MRCRTRALWSSLLSLLVLAFLSVAGASPAGAQQPSRAPVADLTCVISATAHFSPGISLLSQSEKVTGEVQGGTAVSPATPCTSLTGVPYQGFTMKLTGSGSMACSTAALQGGASGTAEVTWNTGATSTLDWSVTTAAMVPVVNVTITSGALAGARVAVAGAPASLTGNCVLDPITSAGFAGAAEFLNLGSE